MDVFDGWTATDVLHATGIGTMEILSWIAAAAAMKTATGQTPQERFYNPCREIGVGFGVAETPPAEVLAA
jgi:hypothetical protein